MPEGSRDQEQTSRTLNVPGVTSAHPDNEIITQDLGHDTFTTPDFVANNSMSSVSDRLTTPTHPGEMTQPVEKLPRKSRKGLVGAGLALVGTAAAGVIGYSIAKGTSNSNATGPRPTISTSRSTGTVTSPAPKSSGETAPTPSQTEALLGGIGAPNRQSLETIATQYGVTIETLPYPDGAKIYADTYHLPDASILDTFGQVDHALTAADFANDKLGNLLKMSIMANFNTQQPFKVFSSDGSSIESTIADRGKLTGDAEFFLTGNNETYSTDLTSTTGTVDGIPTLNVELKIPVQVGGQSMAPGERADDKISLPYNVEFGGTGAYVDYVVQIAQTNDMLRNHIMGVQVVGGDI